MTWTVFSENTASWTEQKPGINGRKQHGASKDDTVSTNPGHFPQPRLDYVGISPHRCDLAIAQWVQARCMLGAGKGTSAHVEEQNLVSTYGEAWLKSRECPCGRVAVRGRLGVGNQVELTGKVTLGPTLVE